MFRRMEEGKEDRGERSNEEDVEAEEAGETDDGETTTGAVSDDNEDDNDDNDGGRRRLPLEAVGNSKVDEGKDDDDNDEEADNVDAEEDEEYGANNEDAEMSGSPAALVQSSLPLPPIPFRWADKAMRLADNEDRADEVNTEVGIAE